LGSRREIERWIQAGRVLVNDEVPAPGAKLGPRDRVTLDGRPVRLRAKPDDQKSHVLLMHRSPGSALDLKDAAARAADHLKAPRASRRWLAVNPLPPVDGGLEILTDDGALAQRLSRGVHALTMDFVLRVRGPLTDAIVADLRAAQEIEGEPMTIIAAAAQYGEGLNHWLNLTVRATRAAQVRHWLAARGIIVSRLIRVRFGPVHLTRELPRGHLREMNAGERNALMNEVDSARAALETARAHEEEPKGPAGLSGV
jgi:23S rRNA pseudouridine2605 synthase